MLYRTTVDLQAKKPASKICHTLLLLLIVNFVAAKHFLGEKKTHFCRQIHFFVVLLFFVRLLYNPYISTQQVVDKVKMQATGTSVRKAR
jgi:hypothetical protein